MAVKEAIMLDLSKRDNGMRNVGKGMAGFVIRLFQRTVIEPRKLNMQAVDIAVDGTRVKVKLDCGAIGWMPIEFIYNEPIMSA